MESPFSNFDFDLKKKHSKLLSPKMSGVECNNALKSSQLAAIRPEIKKFIGSNKICIFCSPDITKKKLVHRFFVLDRYAT